jgi:CBS domain-containing protein
MSVGRICQREIDVAEPSETIAAVAARMQQREVGALVVLDEERRVTGIVTDRDLVLRVLARKKDPQKTLVEDVMTRAPYTVTEETSIENAVSLMHSGEFRRLPIVDDDRRLVGLVSLDDVLLLLCEEFASIRGLLQRETPKKAAGSLG